jgi:uncharacterized protein with GYD domain
MKPPALIHAKPTYFTGRKAMPTYISLMNYTDQGLRNVKKSPGRLDAARKAAEELGGKMGDLYLTMGAYDLVATSHFPEESGLVLQACGDIEMLRFERRPSGLVDRA